MEPSYKIPTDFEDPGRTGTLSYTLEDVECLKQSTWTANSSLDSVSGVISQTGGGPAEKWGEKVVFLTRFFGKTNYPFITFTTTSKVNLESLSFNHYHNHNMGYPSYPSYDVQLQIRTVKDWKDIGSTFTASPQTHDKLTKIDLNGQALDPGSYTVRWIPVNLAKGVDTNTEFFAMDCISLKLVDSQCPDKTGIISYSVYDINNVGPVSTWIAKSSLDSVSGVISQTGGGPAEKWDQKAVFLTRFLGTKNYPFITFTATSKIQLNSLSFNHYHNHNVGFPSHPSYDVGLQLHTDDGWVDISSPFKASAETHGTLIKIGLDGLFLGPGVHKIRWIPVNTKKGFDTNTEFFAMDSISLELTSFSYERDE